MGNKTGKFDVPNAENNNKDDACNDNGVKFEHTNGTEPNGEQINQELNEVEKGDSAPVTKKKNITSWFKKLSMRKPSKTKQSKENGVKEEVIGTTIENGTKDESISENIKENGVNGDIQSEKTEIPQIQNEEKENVVDMCGTSENKEETLPAANEHETNEVAETPVEIQ